MKRAIIDSETMNRLIAATKDFVVPESYTREIYKYIQLRFDSEHNTITAAACDGFRLSVETGTALEIDEDFIAYIRPNYRFPKKTEVLISLEGEEVIIRCNGNITGCAQIKGDFLNYEAFGNDRQKVTFRIAMNPKYLMDAVKAAKVSLKPGSSGPVILEFVNPDAPAYVVTNEGNGFRMVLPIRMRGKFREFGCRDGGQIDE